MKLNDLFEYPVTKTVPYGRLFHISFALFQFLAFCIFVIWAAATAGYDTITISSPNYNMTQTLWYSSFIPGAVQKQLSKESMCSGATSFTPGASFTSTNDLFSYEIESYYAQPGAMTRPSDVVEYRGVSLDSCAPADVLITVDTIRNTVDAVTLVFCYDAWPVVASNHFVFSTSPVKTLLNPGARSSAANKIWTNENSTSTYIFRALDYLAQDLLSTARLAIQQSGGTAPTEYSLNLHARLICPIAYIGTDQTTSTNQDLAIPSQNLAIALHAATVYDLGSTTKVNNNIYTTLSAMNADILTTNTNATTSGVTGSTLNGAVAMRADASFPIPATGPTVVRATYLCRVKQLKNAAGFIIAVVGLSMSLFTSLIGIATIAIVMVLRFHRPDLMHCEGHTPDCHQPVPVALVYDHKGDLVPASSPGLTGLPPPPMTQTGQAPPVLYNNGGYPAPPAQNGWPGQNHQY